MFNSSKEFPAASRRRQLTVLAATILLSGLINQALAFSSGSNGSDGALNFPDAKEGDVILFDPKAFSPPLDSDGDNVYHFTTITQ